MREFLILDFAKPAASAVPRFLWRWLGFRPKAAASSDIPDSPGTGLGSCRVHGMRRPSVCMASPGPSWIAVAGRRRIVWNAVVAAARA